MKEYKYILLDLDRTDYRSDDRHHPMRRIRIESFGIQVNDLRELCPLSVLLFWTRSGISIISRDEQAKERLQKNTWNVFADTGIYENKLYDGMKRLLEEATRQGRILMLATSKPTVFAKRILDYFDIARYFTFVAGSGLDGSFYTKEM